MTLTRATFWVARPMSQSRSLMGCQSHLSMTYQATPYAAIFELDVDPADVLRAMNAATRGSCPGPRSPTAGDTPLAAGLNYPIHARSAWYSRGSPMGSGRAGRRSGLPASCYRLWWPARETLADHRAIVAGEAERRKIVHPMFVSLFIETDADDLLAEEQDRRRRTRQARRGRSARVAKAAAPNPNRAHKPNAR